MLGNLFDNACKWAKSRVTVFAALDRRCLRETGTSGSSSGSWSFLIRVAIITRPGEVAKWDRIV